MKKSEQIIILKAKVKKLKEKLKLARLELADNDSVIDDYIDSFEDLELKYSNQNELIERKNKTIIERNRALEQVTKERDHLQKVLNEIANGNFEIESTQELFEGKGYVYELVNGVKFYRTEIGYSTDKTTAIEFKSLESYFEKYQHTDKDKFHFEPI